MASTAGLRLRNVFSIGAALIVLTLLAEGATAAAQAPGVDWRRSDWFPVHPTNGPQTKAMSGEDWWYDHDNSYDGSRALQGHIAAGFSSFINWTASELPFGGCVDSQPGAPDVCAFESPGNVRGDIAMTMALIDPSGSARLWIKKYGLGFFFRVIQTSDGGYLATGTSPSTRDFAGQPIYYNPGQTPGMITDSFDLGNGCPSTGGDARYRVAVVKTDALGNVQWQYSYGMQPYRDAFGVPQPVKAYGATGLGWDLIETPSGNFLIVGDTIDPQNTYVCGNNNDPQRLSRGFVIEVTQAGHWVSGQFFGPTDAPSTVAAITRVSTSGGDRYVLASNELFPTSSFNGYTGCNLFQKVVVRAVGTTQALPLIWQKTDFDIPIPANETTSQRTDGVEVSSSGEILLPLIEQCAGCLYSGYNTGLGKVFRLDSSGQITGASVVGQVTAFDLKLDVTPTPDGGFATVSTRHTTAPPPPYNCYDTRYWNTDAFVSKFDTAGVLEWSTTFDSPNVQASFPGDEKKQECLYSISQSKDGGFVVAGNDSANFDDDYLAKLAPAPLPPGPALTIRDTPVDSGLEPNPDTGPMWVSDDIWVRHLPDLGTTHQNPVYSVSQPFNYVHVRVTNLGSAPATGTLKVYWAKASTGLNWQTQWVNYTVNGILWGDRLAGTASINLAPGASTVVPVQWTVPNPADFVSFGADKGHFCLLARIETTAGMTFAEGSSVFLNARSNRSIAWKNVTVVEGPMKQGFVVVRNTSRRSAKIRLAFGASRALDRRLVTFLTYGTIDISLDRELLDRWVAGGRVGRGVTALPDGRIRLTAPNAWIGGFRMGPGEMKTISAQFAFRRPSPAVEFRFDILQYSTVLGRESLVGGQRFSIPAPSPRPSPGSGL